LFRKLAKGWATNVVAEMNRHKQEITTEYTCLDLEANTKRLDEAGNNRMKALAGEMENCGPLMKLEQGKDLGIG
jgi:hypothetical protein